MCQVFTSHMIKKLIGLQVSESGEAAGAPEGGAAGGVPFVCLNAASHVIQFVLYNVNQHSKQKQNMFCSLCAIKCILAILQNEIHK